ncbi:GPW/gp25 family protein [Mangrovivirga sp. M17]|uniref:GPW/gp25 family protein n=1 Tax=Mangrovivirga halotolerans TaxID=2993936 RepID=A0ABT3RRS4_9BACT|nr:GPW/gp25 family protein [Mangrovivirga halotolerans]MCX2743875.1 GPW/gp25 family protein [Mangrovivirga halotolerans]
MEFDQEFLGQGWSFPPAFTRTQNQVEMSKGIQDIYESLEIIFTTSLGERVMNPTFGCSLAESVFDALNTGMLAYLRNLIETAILYHEPRIDAENVNLDVDQNNGILFIKVDFKVRTDNSRYNYVYPFYLKEANQ